MLERVMTDVTGDAEFELARLREQQAAVAEVLAAISRMTTDVQPVLDTILAHAKRLCAADDAGLWQREADGLFHFVAHHGTDIPTYLEYARAHPQAETASGTSAEWRAPAPRSRSRTWRRTRTIRSPALPHCSVTCPPARRSGSRCCWTERSSASFRSFANECAHSPNARSDSSRSLPSRRRSL